MSNIMSGAQKLNTYEKSRALFDRAVKVMPSGIPGHLGPVLSQFIPVEAFPFYAKRASGSYFWDYDDNRFIDYMCAYGPNVLGYNDPTVDAAARAQMEDGNCMPLPAAAQVELAEALVDTIAGADWAFFAKNGNDVTSLAVMTARAATGRSKLVLVKGGYHGVAPWTQAAGHAGLTCEDTANNLYVSWNDFEELERTVNEHRGEIACFLATPYHHPVFATNELPVEGYWSKVRKLCDEHGIVLAIDDVRVGFRADLAGSASYFGFEPDLACYCKAMANGYPISALVGRDALRGAISDVFYTGSYWSAAVPMAAALATIGELKRLDGANLMLERGKKLTVGLVAAASHHGIRLQVSGLSSMFYMEILNDKSLWMMQDFTAECARRGVLFTSHHNHFINCSLGEDDIAETVSVAERAFDAVAQAHPEKVDSQK